MAGVIKINPEILKPGDGRDALAVAWDEALRLFMEDTGFEPEFEVTPEQEEFFKNTAYTNGEGVSAEGGGDVDSGLLSAMRKIHTYAPDSAIGNVGRGAGIKFRPGEFSATTSELARTYGVVTKVEKNLGSYAGSAASLRMGHSENRIRLSEIGSTEVGTLTHEFAHIADPVVRGSTPERSEELVSILSELALARSASGGPDDPPFSELFTRPTPLRDKQLTYRRALQAFAEKYGPQINPEQAPRERLKEQARWGAATGTPGTPEAQRLANVLEALSGAGAVTTRLYEQQVQEAKQKRYEKSKQERGAASVITTR